MRWFAGLVLLALVLVILSATPGEGAHATPATNPSPGLGGALSRLGKSLWDASAYYFEVEFGLQVALWNSTPPGLRPLLGMLEFALRVFALVGIYSLLITGRLMSRVT